MDLDSSIIYIIINHFGRNPVSGGSPAKDRNRSLTTTALILEDLNSLFICDAVFRLYAAINRNSGKITKLYIIKYDIEMHGIEIIIGANIHPIWVIDE